MLLAHAVHLAHCCNKLLVVVAEFRKHVERRDIFGIVVGNALQPCNLADGMQGALAYLADAFGNRIRCCVDLIRLLIEQ